MKWHKWYVVFKNVIYYIIPLLYYPQSKPFSFDTHSFLDLFLVALLIFYNFYNLSPVGE